MKVAVLFVLAITSCVCADVVMPEVFQDHMVLQRNKKVAVWGHALDGETVTVSFNSQIVSTVCTNGSWRVDLQPMAAGGPFQMTITGGNTVTISDVLVGEVWYAGGQSNMAYPLGSLNDVENQAELTVPGNDQIRIFIAAHRQHPDFPPESAPFDVSAWYVDDSSVRSDFSATAYYYAKALQAELQVPVGIVNCSWGGTLGEAWMDRSLLQNSEYLQPLEEQYQKALDTYDAAMELYAQDLVEWESGTLGSEPTEPMSEFDKHRPGGLFENMVTSLIPYTMRGFLWYQGEGNALRGWQYRYVLEQLILSYREQWGDDSLPFLMVQLPGRSFGEARAWTDVRDSIFHVSNTHSNTHMVTIIEAGEEFDSHPHDKKLVGDRLSLAARRFVYGEDDLTYTGPRYEGYEISGSNVVVQFSETGQGFLHAPAGQTNFTVCGSDQVWYPADVVFQSNSIVLSSEEVPIPVAARYGWKNWFIPDLFSLDGHSASPFRTDNFDLITRDVLSNTGAAYDYIARTQMLEPSASMVGFGGDFTPEDAVFDRSLQQGVENTACWSAPYSDTTPLFSANTTVYGAVSLLSDNGSLTASAPGLFFGMRNVPDGDQIRMRLADNDNAEPGNYSFSGLFVVLKEDFGMGGSTNRVFLGEASSLSMVYNRASRLDHMRFAILNDGVWYLSVTNMAPSGTGLATNILSSTTLQNSGWAVCDVANGADGNFDLMNQALVFDVSVSVFSNIQAYGVVMAGETGVDAGMDGQLVAFDADFATEVLPMDDPLDLRNVVVGGDLVDSDGYFTEFTQGVIDPSSWFIGFDSSVLSFENAPSVYSTVGFSSDSGVLTPMNAAVNFGLRDLYAKDQFRMNLMDSSNLESSQYSLSGLFAVLKTDFLNGTQNSRVAVGSSDALSMVYNRASRLDHFRYAILDAGSWYVSQLNVAPAGSGLATNVLSGVALQSSLWAELDLANGPDGQFDLTSQSLDFAVSGSSFTSIEAFGVAMAGATSSDAGMDGQLVSFEASLTSLGKLSVPEIMPGENLMFSLSGGVGQKYQLQYRDDLSDGVWSNLQTVVLSSETNCFVELPFSVDTGFYRLNLAE